MLKYSIEGDVLYCDDCLQLDGNGVLDEETLCEAYRHAIKHASPSPLIVYIQRCIQDIDISNQRFQTQLRALLRASVYGELRILFSMVACLEDMVSAKIALAKARQDLCFEGIAYREEIPLGIAVESPSAAVLADALAKECDFFMIDTQNLIRHTLAANYTDQQIKECEALFTPSILILMKCAIEGAHKGGLTCGICGEAAEDDRLLPVLLGWGIDALFMSKDRLNHIKTSIGHLSKENHGECARSLLLLATRSEVIEHLESVESHCLYKPEPIAPSLP